MIFLWLVTIVGCFVTVNGLLMENEYLVLNGLLSAVIAFFASVVLGVIKNG